MLRYQYFVYQLEILQGCFLFKREEKHLHCVIYFGGKIALNNQFYIACITFHYLLCFATKTYAKSHSTPQTPSCVGHAYSLCKGLQPLLFPSSLLNAGCFSFLANALKYPMNFNVSSYHYWYFCQNYPKLANKLNKQKPAFSGVPAFTF